LQDTSPWKVKMDALPYVVLDVLPFRALTVDLNDMHVRQTKNDCTHYCQSPMMFQMVYQQLVHISERVLRQTTAMRVAARINDTKI
jgi:hypothetical protein